MGLAAVAVACGDDQPAGGGDAGLDGLAADAAALDVPPGHLDAGAVVHDAGWKGMDGGPTDAQTSDAASDAAMQGAPDAGDGGRPGAGDGGSGHDAASLDAGMSPTTCPRAADAPLDAGACDVVPGNARRLLTGDLLLPDGVLPGGQVLIDDVGLIRCVGCDCSALADGATQVRCPDAVISPGLVNPHDHLGYAHNLPLADAGERYEHRSDWRTGARGHTELSIPGGATPDQVRLGELRFVLGGATATAGVEAAPGLLRNLDRTEGILLTPPVDLDSFPLGDFDGTQLASGCAYPDITAAAELDPARRYVAHVAEGIDAVARNELVCLGDDANGGQDLLSWGGTSLVHCVGVSAADYLRMAETGTALIWSPRSNVALYGDTVRAPLAHRVGVLLALGSDWLPTGSMSLLRELRCADALNQTHFDRYFDDRALWLMVTHHAAMALGRDDVLGRLAPGLLGDVAIFDARARTGYRAVVGAEPRDVLLVLRGGSPLYGDAALVSAIAGGCEELEVCTVSKQVCAMADTGVALSQILAAAPYPPFACGAPSYEPTCVPVRPVSVDGSTSYDASDAVEADGDGIDAMGDNCPAVFNPVRPVDQGVQPDADADGVGDACDPCPFVAASTTCAGPDPLDRDGDGIPAALDNCPGVANADQLDADQDFRGDACDDCAVANPGPTPCPVSIYEIKGGAVAVGAVRSLPDALVTAVGAFGFYVQARAGDPGYAGEAFSGLFVHAPGSGLVSGTRVDVRAGVVIDFGGQIQLDQVVLASRPVGEVLPDAVPETTAGVATGTVRASELEGVLVRLENVTVSALGPGAGELSVIDASGTPLRVGTQLFMLSPGPAVDDTFTSITGVLAHRGGESSLQPRAVADFVP